MILVSFNPYDILFSNLIPASVKKIAENGKNDAQTWQVWNFWTAGDENKPMLCWLLAIFFNPKIESTIPITTWTIDWKMPSIAKLDFVQVCRLSLNVYSNTLRKFYKFSDSRQSWTSPTLQFANWPISRQYHRPQMCKRVSYPEV